MPGITRHLLISVTVMVIVTATTPTPVTPTATTSTPVTMPAVRLPLPGATLPSGPAEVLPALPTAGPVPTSAGLGKSIGPLLTRPALGRSVSAEVVDVTTGTSLFTKDAVRAAVPASTAKVLTAAAAFTALGPDTTLATRVVRGARLGEVFLLGGGDVLLAPGHGDPRAVLGHAGLADLADATAVSLRAEGTTSVAVRLDDTLFSGPAVNPAWLPDDVRSGFVAPVMAVEVMAGVARPAALPQPGLPAPRLADPALSAARQFAVLLRARGIAVTGVVVRAAAPREQTVLGQVRSASVAGIVEHTLGDSDNTTAEALARLVASAGGRRPTFADSGRAILEKIAQLGLPTAGAQLTDGSGLGRGTVVSAHTLARTLALAGRPENQQLRALLSGLPVAGGSGTLADRFAGSGLTAGVGVVRAKTGTLTGVSSLAGTVVDADGRMLAFAVIADAVPATSSGRAALDAVATVLAGCGCR